MVRALRAQLDRWARRSGDDARVVISAAGERAFSAGGDIRALYDLGQAGRHDEALHSGARNIRSTPRSRIIRKPYVALIDGIVMGGGVGVSVHGSHRVAGDRFQFAMPEVGIGFFPDVGATWFLPRMPGELGTYCALTGERFGIADALRRGPRHPSHCRRRALPSCSTALCGTVPVDAVLAAFAEPAGEGPIMARRAAIDRLFAGDRVEDILAALDAEAASGGADAEWAGKTAATMRANRRSASNCAGAGAARRSHAISRTACAPNSASCRASSMDMISTRACAP